MRPIKGILRLKHQHGLSVREVARSCGLPTSTVGDYLQRATAAGLGWPLPAELSEEQLQAKLLGGAATPVTSPATKALPDWPHLHEELRRKGVTLQLLWQEYRQAEPTGYAYSRFCELYREWAAKLDPVLRQVHGPGEKVFVDWAGQTVPIHDPATGAVTAAHVFVAVLGSYIEIGDAPRLESCNSFIFNETCLQYATAGRILKSQFPAALDSLCLTGFAKLIGICFSRARPY